MYRDGLAGRTSTIMTYRIFYLLYINLVGQHLLESARLSM